MQFIRTKTIDGKQVDGEATLFVRDSSGESPLELVDLFAAGLCKRSDAMKLVTEVKEKAKKDSGEYRDSYFLALEAIKAILEAYQDCQENGFLDSFADTTALEDAIEAARELL
jgi:hypothetical protein